MSTDPATIAPQSDSQPHRAYKPKSSRKAPAIQNAILAKRANGASKLKISKDLQIGYNTVTSVIELNDFDTTLANEQKESLRLVPRAIQVAHDRLTKGSENMAIKVLENTIWPLNAKTSKPHDVGLTLPIQNLMGNVQVNAVAPHANDPAQISGTEPQTPEPQQATLDCGHSSEK